MKNSAFRRVRRFGGISRTVELRVNLCRWNLHLAKIETNVGIKINDSTEFQNGKCTTLISRYLAQARGSKDSSSRAEPFYILVYA